MRSGMNGGLFSAETIFNLLNDLNMRFKRNSQIYKSFNEQFVEKTSCNKILMLYALYYYKIVKKNSLMYETTPDMEILNSFSNYSARIPIIFGTIQI